MLDAIVLSDLHLGSENCQADRILQLLSWIEQQKLPTERIILNGDIFDSLNLQRLKCKHWEVVERLRALSRSREVIWIAGNHDGCSRRLSDLMGVSVLTQCVLHSGSEKILFMHGDAFDEFIKKYPITTWMADRLYNWLQKMDRSHGLARWAKRQSKTFLECARKVRRGAMARAEQLSCTIVCCGHTHHSVTHEENGIAYYNSGCWTELPCSYLTIRDGVVDLREHQSSPPAISVSSSKSELSPVA